MPLYIIALNITLPTGLQMQGDVIGATRTSGSLYSINDWRLSSGQVVPPGKHLFYFGFKKYSYYIKQAQHSRSCTQCPVVRQATAQYK